METPLPGLSLAGLPSEEAQGFFRCPGPCLPAPRHTSAELERASCKCSGIRRPAQCISVGWFWGFCPTGARGQGHRPHVSPPAEGLAFGKEVRSEVMAVSASWEPRLGLGGTVMSGVPSMVWAEWPQGLEVGVFSRACGPGGAPSSSRCEFSIMPEAALAP